MAWREGRKRGGGASLDDLDLSPEDRVGAPSESPNKSPARKPAASPSRRRQHSDDDADPPGRRRRKRKTKREGSGSGWRRVVVRRTFYWGAVLALWALIAAIGMLVWIGIRLPPIQSLEIPKRPPSVLILGDTGATLATRGDMGGAAVPIGELPDYAPNAFIAIEDRRFYTHRGVDPLGIARALVTNVLHRGTAQGGST